MCRNRNLRFCAHSRSFQLEGTDQTLGVPFLAAGQGHKVHVKFPVIVPQADVRRGNAVAQQGAALHQFEEIAVVANFVLHTVHGVGVAAVRPFQVEIHLNDVAGLYLFLIAAVHGQLKEEVTGVIHCHRRGNAGQEKHDRK